MQVTPDIVQRTMDDVAALTGRPLRLFDYYGHPQADRVVAAMGSSASVLQEAVDHLNAQGQRVGMINVSAAIASGVCWGWFVWCSTCSLQSVMH
jgi:pyruvate-ferredoxin/flavodoxin oxidoreductase